MNRLRPTLLIVAASFLLPAPAAGQGAIVIRAGTLLDGKGGAIARGQLPGPRLLTSIASLTDTAITPDQIRQWVRGMVGRGADLIKIFASKSIREGGAQTLSDEQIRAACEEARAAGKRIWVHAHAASAARVAALAGCFAVTHGSQLTEREFALMAERGTFFEPNIGLVSQNYIENKPRYLGIGNYNEEGFAYMERGIPLKLSMFKTALKQRGLKLIMGTVVFVMKGGMVYKHVAP